MAMVVKSYSSRSGVRMWSGTRRSSPVGSDAWAGRSAIPWYPITSSRRLARFASVSGVHTPHQVDRRRPIATDYDVETIL